MLALPQFEGLHEAYIAIAGQIADHYEYVNAPRGNASRECLHMGFTLADPVRRVPFLASRKVNIVFHFAEALWYLWGRSDLEMMAYYAPQMRSYSMDGVTLRGSAYGARLFGQAPDDGPSAFGRVLDLIREDLATKRAVLTMFRQEELAVPGNLDVACILAFQLVLRDGRLHGVCYLRANDADQGLLSDVFSFTLLLEFAARQLGVPVGTYTHFAGSMHLGDGNLPRIRLVLAEARDISPAGERFAFPSMPGDASWADLETIQVHEELLRVKPARAHTRDDHGDRACAVLATGAPAVRGPPADPSRPGSRQRRRPGSPGPGVPVAAAPPLARPGSRRRVRGERRPVSMWHPRIPGSVLGGVAWARFSVVMLKPDCLHRGLEDEVLGRVATEAEIIARETVTVDDWQIFVHYADLLVDADWFRVDVVSYLRRFYVGQDVVIALVRGRDETTPTRVRALLGHYDPQRAVPGTIRGDLGTDSQEKSRAEGRLIENLVHSSDDATTVCRDFGTWFGANRYQLVSPAPVPGTLPNPMEDM